MTCQSAEVHEKENLNVLASTRRTCASVTNPTPPPNCSDFSGELSEGADSPEAEETKNKEVEGEFVLTLPVYDVHVAKSSAV